jgi:hypothetical protein
VIRNDSSEKVSFKVLYHTKASGKFKWEPSQPSNEPDTYYAFELAPGEAHVLMQNEQTPITANMIRIHAKSATREWKDGWERDLLTVPETDAAGNHVYQAAEIDVHTFRIRD